MRRTDKVSSEAALHQVEEYMRHVDDWFRFREKINPVEERRVYLATDDPSVLIEARKKYVEITIVCGKISLSILG